MRYKGCCQGNATGLVIVVVARAVVVVFLECRSDTGQFSQQFNGQSIVGGGQFTGHPSHVFVRMHQIHNCCGNGSVVTGRRTRLLQCDRNNLQSFVTTGGFAGQDTFGFFQKSVRGTTWQQDQTFIPDHTPDPQGGPT